MNKTHLSTFVIISSLILCGNTLAEFDVDDADSLDFESFHADKTPDKKVWRTQKKATSETTFDRIGGKVASVEQTGAGEVYEIRQRYSLYTSHQTRYSAFYVIEAMHRQMAELCPSGWQKLREWSTPINTDFYLYYELKCL